MDDHCLVGNCKRVVYAKGYCHAHYTRARLGHDMEKKIGSRRRLGFLAQYDDADELLWQHIANQGATIKAIVRSARSVCDVCGSELDLLANGDKARSALDHDHETGKLRGILCHGCNVAVGFYEKRIVPNLDAFTDYLESPPGVEVSTVGELKERVRALHPYEAPTGKCGTELGYKHGCRCEECRAASSSGRSARRERTYAERKARGEDRAAYMREYRRRTSPAQQELC